MSSSTYYFSRFINTNRAYLIGISAILACSLSLYWVPSYTHLNLQNIYDYKSNLNRLLLHFKSPNTTIIEEEHFVSQVPELKMFRQPLATFLPSPVIECLHKAATKYAVGEDISQEIDTCFQYKPALGMMENLIYNHSSHLKLCLFLVAMLSIYLKAKYEKNKYDYVQSTEYISENTAKNAIRNKTISNQLEDVNEKLRKLETIIEIHRQDFVNVHNRIQTLSHTNRADIRNLQGRLNRGGDVRREFDKIKETLTKICQNVFKSNESPEHTEYQLNKESVSAPTSSIPSHQMIAVSFKDTNESHLESSHLHSSIPLIVSSEPSKETNPEKILNRNQLNPLNTQNNIQNDSTHAFINEDQPKNHIQKKSQDSNGKKKSKCVLTVGDLKFDLSTDEGRKQWNEYLSSRQVPVRSPSISPISDLFHAQSASRYSPIYSLSDTTNDTQNSSHSKKSINEDMSNNECSKPNEKIVDCVLNNKNDNTFAVVSNNANENGKDDKDIDTLSNKNEINAMISSNNNLNTPNTNFSDKENKVDTDKSIEDTKYSSKPNDVANIPSASHPSLITSSATLAYTNQSYFSRNKPRYKPARSEAFVKSDIGSRDSTYNNDRASSSPQYSKKRIFVPGKGWVAYWKLK